MSNLNLPDLVFSPAAQANPSLWLPLALQMESTASMYHLCYLQIPGRVVTMSQEGSQEAGMTEDRKTESDRDTDRQLVNMENRV